MNAKVAMRVVLSLIIVALSAANAGAQAQTISISVNTLSACDNSPLGNVAVQLNGVTYRTNGVGEAFPPKMLPYVIQVRAAAPGLPSGKVAYVVYAEANKSGQQKYAADASGVATFNPGNGGALLVYMGACAGKTIKVKIATTKSCTDKAGTGFSVQHGVVVTLGRLTFTSNANGVIEANVPPGTYTVSASWKDYPLGYVAENGLRQKRNEDGKITVRLTDPGETLEVRTLICDPDGQPKARAKILEIGTTRVGPGSISVTRSRASGKGFVGMKLRDGDVVKISGTAKLKWLQSGGTISFDDPRSGSIIVIGPESVPAGNKAQDYSPSVLQVLKGIGEFLLPPNEDADAPRDANGNIIKFGASSRTVNLGIKGTRFRFGYDPQTNTSPIVVEEGTVWITPKNASLKPFMLQAGQKVTVAQNRVGPITARSAAAGAGQSGAGTGTRTIPSLTTRSAHGCVGFNGTWQGPGGTMHLRNGSGTYGDTTLQATVSGNTSRGTWRHPTVGQGTFIFTLAPDGDSFGTVWVTSAGVSGSYDTVRCVGP